MAWIIGSLGPEELRELRSRGWEDEDLPVFTAPPPLDPEPGDVTRAFYVDSDVLAIMTGPGWAQRPPDAAEEDGA